MRDETLVEDDVLTSPQFKLNLDTLIQVTAEIASQVGAIADLDELVETATQLLRQKLGYDQVTLQLLDSDQQKFMLKIQSHAGQNQATQSCLPDNFASLPHRAARRQAVICIGDLAVDEPGFFPADNPAVRSELHLPLQQDDRIVGVLSIGCQEKYAFDNPEVTAVFKMLASQLAVAIGRAFQHEKAVRNQADARIYSQVAHMHHIVPELQSQTGGVHDVFDKVVRGVVEGLEYTAAVLAVVDEERQTLPVQAIAFSDFYHHQNWDLAEQLLGVQIIGRSVSLAEDRKNLAVQTCLTGAANVTHKLHDLFQPVADHELCGYIQNSCRIKTFATIPLKVEHMVLGVLCAGTEKEEISATDLDSLNFFATHAAIALQNSIHYHQVSQSLQRREAELDQLRRIERMINSSLDLEIVLTHILNGALELTGADYSQVVLAGKYASDLVQQVSYPETGDAQCIVQPGLVGLLNHQPLPEIKQVKELLLKNNRYLRENSSPAVANVGPGPRSLLGTTISLGNELIGVLNIASQQDEVFNSQSLDLLEQIAVQAAIAIRNAYQFKTERDIRERLANVSQVVAMGDMASNMVHSINNWVGAIRADLKYMMRQHAQDKLKFAELNELLVDMLTNADATLAMAENIKKPFQASEQELIDVNESILHVLQEKRSNMINAIIIEDLQPVPPILATHQLELVFENLLNNALQAMKDQVRGVIKFTSRLSKDGQWVLVTVQDSGSGLPEHLDPADIFKLGVSGRKDGLGYGLWWCDTFLKRWGGRIQYVNNVKRGCKFLVRLPISGLNSLEQQGGEDD